MDASLSDDGLQAMVRGVLQAISEGAFPDTQIASAEDVLVITNENEEGTGDSEIQVSKVGTFGKLTSVGLAIRVLTREDAVTVLRQAGVPLAATQIATEALDEGYNWFVVCVGEECRIGSFRRPPMEGFTSPRQSSFRDWVTGQHRGGLQHIIQAQPNFAREHNRSTLICCIALGASLDEILPPEARAPLVADPSIDAACFPMPIAQVCSILREIGQRPSPKAFSLQEAEQTIGAILMVAKSCPEDEIVLIASRGQQLAVSRIHWSVAEEKSKTAPVVNAKGGSC